MMNMLQFDEEDEKRRTQFFRARHRKALKHWVQSPITKVGIGLLIIAIIVSVLQYINLHAAVDRGGATIDIYQDDQIIEDYFANFATELIGIAITVLLIDYVYQRQQNRQLKASLIRQMRSRHPEVVDEAISELRHNGWGFYYDESLVGVDLQGTRLQNSQLNLANLRSAYLMRANLNGANLEEANLRGAHLYGARLADARLTKANLENAGMHRVDMQGAELGRMEQGSVTTGTRITVSKRIRMFLSREYATQIMTPVPHKITVTAGGGVPKGASMCGAILTDSILRGAIFIGANLTDVNLKGSDLSGALISPEQLSVAKSLRGTVMPDGSTTEGWAIKLYENDKIDINTFESLITLAAAVEEEEE